MNGDCPEVNNRTHVWGWIDTRTRQKVAMSACSTRAQAERQLDEWHERDRKGGRPDLHDLMPHIAVALIPFGSSPGDVIPEYTAAHDGQSRPTDQRKTP